MLDRRSVVVGGLASVVASAAPVSAAALLGDVDLDAAVARADRVWGEQMALRGLVLAGRVRVNPYDDPKTVLAWYGQPSPKPLRERVYVGMYMRAADVLSMSEAELAEKARTQPPVQMA